MRTAQREREEIIRIIKIRHNKNRRRNKEKLWANFLCFVLATLRYGVAWGERRFHCFCRLHSLLNFKHFLRFCWQIDFCCDAVHAFNGWTIRNCVYASAELGRQSDTPNAAAYTADFCHWTKIHKHPTGRVSFYFCPIFVCYYSHFICRCLSFNCSALGI